MYNGNLSGKADWAGRVLRRIAKLCFGLIGPIAIAQAPTASELEKPVIDGNAIQLKWNSGGDLEVAPSPNGPWRRVGATTEKVSQSRLSLELEGNRFFRIVDNGIPGAVQPLIDGNPRKPYRIEVAFLRRGSGDQDGTARLEVHFESGQNVPERVPLLVNGTVLVFNDAGQDADSKPGDGFHSASVVISVEELKETNDLLASLPADVRKRAVFRGRELIGVEELGAFDLVAFEKGEPIQIFPSPFNGGGIQLGQLSRKARLAGMPVLDPLPSDGLNPTALIPTTIPSLPPAFPPTLRTNVLLTNKPPVEPALPPIPVPPPPIAGGDVLRKSLLITDLSVVEDPRRTWDPCRPHQGTRLGAWTFGKLMIDMCNEPKSGIKPHDFVRRWLRSWQTEQVINFDTVTNRQVEILDQVIRDWENASGGPDKPLDLSIAPFRLLAIVNRVDLRGNPGYGATSNEDPCNPPCVGGEARFVFGVVPGLKRPLGLPVIGAPIATRSSARPAYPDPLPNPNPTNDVDGVCGELPFTVILEYCVPKNTCESIRQWGLEWYNLSRLEFGPSFNDALERLTAQFATAGADPRRKPNESALSQLRSNELLRKPWEMREWRIFPNDSDVGQLREVTAKQTPDFDHNFSKLIVEYCNAFSGDILAGRHTVPLQFGSPAVPFLGGSAPMTDEQFFWDGPPPKGTSIPTSVRHAFSLNTCSGCHAGETGTPFTHVFTRLAGQEARLSDFLTGNNMPKVDPADGTTVHTFADLKRREQDLLELIGTPCFFQLFKQPVEMKH